MHRQARSFEAHQALADRIGDELILIDYSETPGETRVWEQTKDVNELQESFQLAILDAQLTQQQRFPLVTERQKMRNSPAGEAEEDVNVTQPNGSHPSSRPEQPRRNLRPRLATSYS